MDGFKSLLETSFTPSPAVFAIGLAVVLLIPILLHYILHSATPYTSLPTVLLVGPSGAGKTALLTLFERGPLSSPEKPTATPATPALTHTSQTPSSVELAVSENRSSSSFRDDLDATGATATKFLLLDTPGHGKLRRHALSRLSSSSSPSSPTRANLRAIIFVLDAADRESLPDAAEYLYDVLLALQRTQRATRTSKAANPPPVLVAANKEDLFTALPAALVRSNLEAELGRLRRTRSRALPDSGAAGEEVQEEDDEAAWLGEYGSEKFAFGQMREFGIEVDVIGGNVVGDGPGVDRWWRWIAERI